MPIYEYVCPNGHVAEDRRKIEERHRPLTCLECTRAATLKVSVPAVAVVAGGTGAQSAG